MWKDIVPILTKDRSNQGIHPISLDRLRTRFQTEGFLPLSQALRHLLKNAAATNPRDFIYGILSLVDTQDHNYIQVDYTIELLELYQQVSRLL